MNTDYTGYTWGASTHQPTTPAPSSLGTQLTAASACQTLHQAGVGNVCKQIEANAELARYQTQLSKAIGKLYSTPDNRREKTDINLLMEAFFEESEASRKLMKPGAARTAVFVKQLHVKYRAALDFELQVAGYPDTKLDNVKSFLQSTPGVVHVWVDARDLHAVFAPNSQSWANGSVATANGGYASNTSWPGQFAAQSFFPPEGSYPGTYLDPPVQASQTSSPLYNAAGASKQPQNNFGYSAQSLQTAATAPTGPELDATSPWPSPVQLKVHYDMLVLPQTFKSFARLPLSFDKFTNPFMKPTYDYFFLSHKGRGFSPNLSTAVSAFAERLRSKCMAAVHAAYNKEHGKHPDGPIYWVHDPIHRDHFKAWLNENPGVCEISVDTEDVHVVFLRKSVGI